MRILAICAAALFIILVVGVRPVQEIMANPIVRVLFDLVLLGYGFWVGFSIGRELPRD